MDQGATWYGGKPSPGDVALDGVGAPCAQKWHSPQFSVHVYCRQTAGWTKTSLCTEVDLFPAHIVLDGHPAAPPRKWHTSPLFSVHVYCGHGRSSQLLLSSCYVCGSRVVVVVVAVVVVVVVVFVVVVVVVESATKFKYVSNRSKLCKGMTLVECCYHGLNQ